jgi:hypothetical protein
VRFTGHHQPNQYLLYGNFRGAKKEKWAEILTLKNNDGILP